MMLSDMDFMRQRQSVMIAANQSVSRFRQMMKNVRSQVAPSSQKQQAQHTRVSQHGNIPTYSHERGKRLSSILEEPIAESSQAELRPSSLEVIIELLSSPDIDRNRLGMQRLLVITKTRRNLSGCSSFEVSNAIVFGSEPADVRLRDLIATFLHDQEEGRDDSSSTRESLQEEDICDDCSTTSFEEIDPNPQGKSWGALHIQALRVVANALEQILSSRETKARTEDLLIPFEDTFWQQIVATLVHNIEWCHSKDITRSSLMILRLLHTLEPVVVTPLLEYTLLPHLIQLKESGDMTDNITPIIGNEASRLLKRANVAC